MHAFFNSIDLFCNHMYTQPSILICLPNRATLCTIFCYIFLRPIPGQQAALAQNNRALALDKGEKIYYQMRQDKFMKDHRSRLRTYPNTFSGQEFVGWLIEKEEAADNGEAVLLGQALLENGVIHHSEL